MSKVKDGGIVTAYGAAVRGGYVGTYQQFCAALGQLAEVLEEFEGFSVEVTTLNPGAPATADYNDGVLTLGIPRGETGNGIQSAVLNSNYTLTLTWTNGEHTTVGPIRGAVGATPNLTIGDVQTLQPSQPATATITGTPEDPVLNFGIPKGDPGSNGVSPAVTITEITDGHRVTITDGDHPQGQSFDVMDGQDGASDAGDVTYDETATYQSGTVGAELSSQKNAIDQLDTALNAFAETGEYKGETTLTVDDLVQGVWKANSIPGGASYRVRSKDAFNVTTGDKITVTVGTGFKVTVNFYGSEPDGITEQTQVTTTGWMTSSFVYTATQTLWAVINIGNTEDTGVNPTTVAGACSFVVPGLVKTHSEIRLDSVDEDLASIDGDIADLSDQLEDKATLNLVFQNMFDKNTMIVGYNMAYDKTGTIEGTTPNLLNPFNNYTAIKIPLHGESSVSLKQTTTTGISMVLWGWYAVDENMIITSAYGSRISQYIQNGYTLSNIPQTAKYLLLSVAYYQEAETRNENLMVVQGDTPEDYLPYVSPWYEIDGLRANVTPNVQKQIDANTAHRQWLGKTWSQYGDSISTYADIPSIYGTGWAKYVNDYQGFLTSFMRGIGGQSFAYGANGGSVAFINADGSLNSVNQSYNYDNYTGEVPSGTTKCRGSLCSWLRITSMFPASIKDSIDLVFVMGGTNDTANTTVPTWVEESTVDHEWAESSYYADFGGDYNIETLQGGVASTIMKMQAWMPQALIVVGTPLNGRTDTTGEKKPDTIPSEYAKSNQIIESARMFAAPVVDVFGGCGINVANSDLYIGDGVHPNDDGRKLLGKFVAGEFNRIMPIS